MNKKEKLATDYMASNTKHYKTIEAENSWTGGKVIMSTYDPELKKAWLSGFEKALQLCGEALHDWEGVRSDAFNEIGNENE